MKLYSSWLELILRCGGTIILPIGQCCRARVEIHYKRRCCRSNLLIVIDWIRAAKDFRFRLLIIRSWSSRQKRESWTFLLPSTSQPESSKTNKSWNEILLTKNKTVYLIMRCFQARWHLLIKNSTYPRKSTSRKARVSNKGVFSRNSRTKRPRCLKFCVNSRVDMN